MRYSNEKTKQYVLLRDISKEPHYNGKEKTELYETCSKFEAKRKIGRLGDFAKEAMIKLLLQHGFSEV